MKVIELASPPIDEPVDWRDHALCATGEYRRTFRYGGARQQKEVCMKCPVRIACLEAELAVEWKNPSLPYGGIFGGKNQKERKNIIQVRKREGKL